MCKGIKMINLFNSIKIFNLLNLITFLGQAGSPWPWADRAGLRGVTGIWILVRVAKCPSVLPFPYPQGPCSLIHTPGLTRPFPCAHMGPHG